MYITETHLHTSEVSACGKVRAEEMVRLYKKAGYSTVCISDHFMKNTFNEMGDIPWCDKVVIFLSGYYKAKRAGDILGVNVIFAPECTFYGAPNDYIVLGMDRAFIESHPEIINMTIEEFYPLAHENGLFVIQAHPHRDNYCYPTPDFVDAIEVYNSNSRHDDHSDKSLGLAVSRALHMTAGSDAHRLEDVALSGLISETEVKNAADLIDLIRSGNAKIYRKDDVR